jgi:hypothetical protein
MSVISIINSVGSVLIKVVPVLIGALRSLRSLVPEIDEGFAKVEAAIESGEIAADDFIDENYDAFMKVKEIGGEIRELGSAVYEACDFLLIAADDDKFTTAEAQIALLKLKAIAERAGDIADIDFPEFDFD